MLTNQAVPEAATQRLRERLARAPGIASVARIEAIYLGPGQALVAAEVRLEDGLAGADVAGALARARDDVRAEVPNVARLYLTPVEGP
jgi:hypothetical protein